MEGLALNSSHKRAKAMESAAYPGAQKMRLVGGMLASRSTWNPRKAGPS